MPKMKTHRAAAKRFKVTGGGHIKRHKGSKSHLLTGKTRGRKRRLKQATLVTPQFEAKIKRLIPYK